MTSAGRLSLLIGAATACLPGILLSADTPGADTTGNRQIFSRLVIQSTPESALVMIDAKVAGFTPLMIDSVHPGIHSVTIQHPDLESWLTVPVTDTIRVLAGEQRTLRYTPRFHHLLRSIPFGAEVVLEDSVIGTTPLLTGIGAEGKLVTLRKDGYEPLPVQLLPGLGPVVEVSLKKDWKSDGTGESVFRDADGGGSRSAGLTISGVATVISGVAAAYLKIKADDRYQQYLDTNDSKYLSQTHRLDTAAGVAIAATQISLGLFTYFIFSK